MSDPTRLLSGEADDFERQLLGSWGAEQPSDAARARVLAIVGVGAAAGTAAIAGGSIAPKAGAVGAAAMAKWIVIGAIGVATAGAAIRYVGGARHDARVAAPMAVAAPRVVLPSPAPVDTIAPPAAQESSPAPGATSPRHAPSPEKSARSTDPALGEQVSALDHARRSLADGDAAGALRHLDDYEARFPHGALVEEAEALRVESLLAEGDRASATRVGSRFLAAHPDSPHAARVRALLGQAPGP